MSETAKARSSIEGTWYALDQQVLAVMIVNHLIGDWRAYVGAVPGKRHSNEWQRVASHGTHLPRRVAEVLFAGHLEALNAERKTAGQEPLRWRG